MIPPKPHKYHAKPIEVDGIKFASRREAKRWGQLQLLHRGGEITDLRRQVKFALIGRDGPILTPTGRQAHYVADFVYIDRRNGLETIEDSKGAKTPEYSLKRAILAAQGITIKEV